MVQRNGLNEMRKVIILGASGGCVDILDTILDINFSASEPEFDVVGFLDDREELWGSRILGAKVLGPFAAISNYDDCEVVTGIGSPYNYWRREAIIGAYNIPPERFACVVHPSASISTSASIGLGTVIHQNVVITTGAKLGANVLVLPNSVISHGSGIGDFTIINAGVCLGGDVSIGRCCYLGARSAVRQDIGVGDNSQLGMGSVVIEDVPHGTVVVGNPAKILREIDL
mgnify:FL=1